MNIYDPSFKGAILRSMTASLYVNQHAFQAKQKTFLICKEHFMSLPVVILTRKNFYLTEAINKKIGTFQAAGLIDYWNSRPIDPRYANIKKDYRPGKLSLQHLSGCFILLFSGLLVTFVVFLTEIAVKIVQSMFIK